MVAVMAGLWNGHLSVVSRRARSVPWGFHLLHFHQPLEERGQLWTGLWTPAHRHLIQGALAGCTLTHATSARGPPHASHTSGHSITKHWRTKTRDEALRYRRPPRAPPRLPPHAHPRPPGSGDHSPHPMYADDGSGPARFATTGTPPDTARDWDSRPPTTRCHHRLLRLPSGGGAVQTLPTSLPKAFTTGTSRAQHRQEWPPI